jgi:hypothetical protein
MMDIFFSDPDEIPLPPREVRIREMHADFWSDGHRVRITIEVDPFQQRPSLDAVILGPLGNELADASIIETMTRVLEFNMHLRGEILPGEYILQVKLYYNQESGQDAQGDQEASLEPIIVDRRVITFIHPAAV